MFLIQCISYSLYFSCPIVLYYLPYVIVVLLCFSQSWSILSFSIKIEFQISAFLEIHDIAGLVRGAHQGQGLGNSFLSHIRAVDGIFHVLRKIHII